MVLAIEIDSEGEGANGLRVTLQGSLDTSTAPDFKRKLDQAITGSTRLVVIDFSGLLFLSSAGLQVLAAAQKQLKDRGGKVVAVNMQPQIRKVFEIVRAAAGFSVFSSTAELDAYLAGIQGGVPEED